MRSCRDRPVRQGAARCRIATAGPAAGPARARLQRVRHRQGNAVRRLRPRQGARRGGLGCQPAGPRDGDAAALGGHQQPARDHPISALEGRRRGRDRRRAAVHAAALGDAAGAPGSDGAAGARGRRPRAARRRGLRVPAPGGAVRAHGRGGVPGGARRGARRAGRGRHDAAHVVLLEGVGRGPHAAAAHAGRLHAPHRPLAREHCAALGYSC